MLILDEMSDHDPDEYLRLRGSIIDAAQTWCQHRFGEEWADVRELGDFPIIYNDETHGYHAIVIMPNYPQGVRVEILISPDKLLGVYLAWL